MCGTADAGRGEPPRSTTLEVDKISDLEIALLGAIEPKLALAEDQAALTTRPAPKRVALGEGVSLSPAENGSWEDLADGGRLWRLRVHAPGATDLSFGFAKYRLPAGATLHIMSEVDGFYQGPFTFKTNKAHGEFWSPVVPGERAVLELYVPANTQFEPELQLTRVGRGYRDLFRRNGDLTEKAAAKRATCNINVACSEGDPWRDEIRSVGMYVFTVGPDQFACSGTLITDVPGSLTPFVLSAEHCPVDASNDQTVVMYWNHQTDNCQTFSDPNLSQNQSGAIYRASRQDIDMRLFELEDQPSSSFNVYYSGWDARTSTRPQSSVHIHHPNADEKSITFNDDPLTLNGGSCGGISCPANDYWCANTYERGTTERGSSGSGVWDPATHLLVGFLSNGVVADDPCVVDVSDCHGRLAVGWDGSSSDSRLRDWLDPGSTGTRFKVGADSDGNGGNGGNSGSNWSCGNVGYDNDVAATAAFFGGGLAGSPDHMFAVRFDLADFGYQAGNTQITSFCATNQINFGGPWPNEVFIYPDSGGVPDDSTILGQGTISTGDGGGFSEVTLPAPVDLSGDFWLVVRGDSQWNGEDFNVEYDGTDNTGNSYISGSGISGLGLFADGNLMLRATLQESGGNGGNGYGDGAYNYFIAAIAHVPGVGDAFWRSKMGVLNRSGSTADVTMTYFWNNGPTTVKKAVKRNIANGTLATWDDAAVNLFGVNGNSSGSVLVNSTRPLVVTARTYTTGDDGSYGSFLPGVTATDGLSSGEIGVLSQLTGNSVFRTNVGLVNLSNKGCEVRTRVVSSGGSNVGSPVTRNLGAYKWKQINNIFGAAGAGTRANAYVTVEVLTSGCTVWAYGAVIDGTSSNPGTDDATTIPLSVID
jgi:hypothetical protein